MKRYIAFIVCAIFLITSSGPLWAVEKKDKKKTEEIPFCVYTETWKKAAEAERRGRVQGGCFRRLEQENVW